MPTSRFQPSFGGGVVGSALYGRIDTQKYDVALKVGRNCFIHVHGGVSNRAGTEFVAEVMDSSKRHRLLPFKRSQEENLVLVLGDSVMRIVDDGEWLMSGGAPYQISTPFNEARAQKLDFAQSVDVVYMTQNEVYPQKLSRNSEINWSFANLNINPSIAAPSDLAGTASDAGSETYKYKISAIVDGVEGLPSSEVSISSDDLDVDGRKITLTWTAVSGQEYNIYKERNGVFGYIGFTEDGSFIDDNIGQDLTRTPVEPAERFQTSNDYPSVVNLFQQRLIVGGSINEPETIYPSRIGNYENFTRSRVLRADDSFVKSVTADGIAEVKSMLQLRELLIFTSSGEFSLTGPDGVLAATNPIETQFGYSGSRAVKPLVVEDTALFVDRTGRQVRDLRYAFEQDGYSGNDLTVFVPQYFRESRIAGWAFAKNPFSVVWAYLENGQLLSLTYKREHKVWAWCDHDLSGGLVEQITVIPEGDIDRVYLMVKRTINGQEKRYIERMDDREFVDVEDAWFVDCGIKYEGAATTTITGLDHLEGETVSALADGNVEADLTVTGGQVTLQRAASKVIVGLPYYAEIENLSPAVELQDVGSARGRPISVNKINIQVERTRGIKAGHARDRLNEIVQTKADLSESIGMETNMISIQLFPNWNKQGTVIVRQDYPLPMTVLGISPEITIGRSD